MFSTQVVIGLLFSAQAFAASQSAASAYTPLTGTCPPNFSLIRKCNPILGLQPLSFQEISYVAERRITVLPNAWKTYAKNVKAVNNDLPDYVNTVMQSLLPPNLGIAASGGGYRAAIFGAGVLDALDGRNAAAVKAGTGGLLQSATYLSGLSGGSWLVTSLAQANFPTPRDLVFGTSADQPGWLANYDIFQPGTPAQGAMFLGTLFQETLGKLRAGYPITFADIWSRGLARHFVSGTTEANFFDPTATHGAGVTFSGIASLSSFASFSQPFPIILANLKSDKGNSSNTSGAGNPIPLSNTMFEFNVYEMGSYDPTLSAFTPTKYLGTRNKTQCVTGYDQASFVFGTSSQLFNEYNTTAGSIENSTIGPIIQLLEQNAPQTNVELDATQLPNPFYGVSPKTFLASDQQSLTLVDGGEDGEVIPIQPLLVKSRLIDVILALDSSSNGPDNYPAGGSLIASQARARLYPQSYSFPPVPETMDTFVNQGLTTRPTFFGCNSNVFTPLVIYLANSGPRDGSPPATNTSTFQTVYPSDQIQTMFNQTFAITTRGRALNSTAVHDPEWPACLACAVADRGRNRLGIKRSGVCSSCFDRYCWDGSETPTTQSVTRRDGRLSAREQMRIMKRAGN